MYNEVLSQYKTSAGVHLSCCLQPPPRFIQEQEAPVGSSGTAAARRPGGWLSSSNTSTGKLPKGDGQAGSTNAAGSGVGSKRQRSTRDVSAHAAGRAKRRSWGGFSEEVLEDEDQFEDDGWLIKEESAKKKKKPNTADAEEVVVPAGRADVMDAADVKGNLDKER